VGLIDEKNKGRKSLATVTLNNEFTPKPSLPNTFKFFKFEVLLYKIGNPDFNYIAATRLKMQTCLLRVC
jgi:hypothetical protein